MSRIITDPGGDRVSVTFNGHQIVAISMRLSGSGKEFEYDTCNIYKATGGFVLELIHVLGTQEGSDVYHHHYFGGTLEELAELTNMSSEAADQYAGWEVLTAALAEATTHKGAAKPL